MPLNPFAHLMGTRSRAAEDEDDKEARKAKGKRAEDDDEKPDAEDDDEDDANASAEDDDEDAEDDEDKPSGKKAKGKKAEEQDDDEKAAASVAKGRRIEKKRCAAIFASPHAATRPDLAASMAFDTNLTSKQAIHQLSIAASVGNQKSTGGRMSLDERMQNERHRIGHDAEQPAARGPQGAVTSMANLYNRHKGIH